MLCPKTSWLFWCYLSCPYRFGPLDYTNLPHLACPNTSYWLTDGHVTVWSFKSSTVVNLVNWLQGAIWMQCPGLSLVCVNHHTLLLFEWEKHVLVKSVMVYTSQHRNDYAPRSRATRNSRFRCSSFMNSSFWRKSAMRSSSRYCLSLRSCSEAPDAPAAQAACWGSDAREDDGSRTLLWEL